MKKLVYACLCATIFFGLAGITKAEEIPQIYISEINWAGSELSTADEWIELYNPNSTSVDIGGWILTGAATSGDALSIEIGTYIDAVDVILISNYASGHEKTTLEIQPNLVTSSLSLPNSNLDIMLTDPNGYVVDEATTDSSPDFGSTNPKASMERNLTTLEWETATEFINLIHNQAGTPGLVNLDKTVNEIVTTENETSQIEETEEIEEMIIEIDNIETNNLPEIENQNNKNNEEDVDNPETFQEEEEEEVIDIIDNSTEILNENFESESDITEIVENTDNIINNEQSNEPDTDTSIYEVDEVIDEIITTPEIIDNIVEVENETEIEKEAVDQNESNESEKIISNVSNSIKNQNNEVEYLSKYIPVGYQSGRLELNEIVSNPEDGDEWIEIYNPGDKISDLNFWSVRDASGKTTTFTSEIISPKCYAIIKNPSGKLNNNGDTVELLDPRLNIIDSITYGTEKLISPQKGESLIKTGGSWYVTSIPTPLAQNKTQTQEKINEQYAYKNEEFIENNSSDTDDRKNEQKNVSSNTEKATKSVSDISDAKERIHTIIAVAETEKVSSTAKTNTSKKTYSTSGNASTSVTGLVTALPGTFGTQIAYISGTELYFHHADWPNLNIGDEIKVSGTPSDSVDERLKISSESDIQILGNQNLEPENLTILESHSKDVGVLVKIKGDILNWNGKTLILSDESGEIDVVAHKNTNIAWNSLNSSEIEVTGIIHWDNGKVQIYPRNKNDIVEINKKEQVETEPKSNLSISNSTNKIDPTPWIGLGLMLIVAGALLFWYFRSQTQTLKPNHI